MKHFQRLANGVDVSALLHAVQRQPQLWNQQDWRTKYAGTPHAEVEDIWLRYSSPDATGNPADLSKVLVETAATWYPAAKDLPQWRGLVFPLMHSVGAYELGRLLITKLKPGGRILRHSDTGAAYTDPLDGGRYHIVLQGLPGSCFLAGDEKVTMLSGDVWWFDHRADHSVENNSADSRIHLLVDLKLA